MSANLERHLGTMRSGDWYCCFDPTLEQARAAAREACHAHNTMVPADRGALAPQLARLLGRVSKGVFVEAPFQCAYGINLSLGARVYLNAGCVILDTGLVEVGDDSMLGPGVHIYCADHHRDPALRNEGMERALPVRIGRNTWIGGGAILLPGVTIGDEAIVGAGAVVTRSVAPGARVVGNPARVI